MVTVTVRLVRSFEFNNVKPVVLHDVDLSLKTEEFLKFLLEEVPNRSGLPPPFKKFQYDTLKISHKAHGTKSGCLTIGTEGDDKLILMHGRTLKESGIENETEISLFKMMDYIEFKKSSSTEVKWM